MKKKKNPTKNKTNQRIEQSNEKKMKETRRSKKTENALSNFEVFY